jgi:type II secretory pathway component GspD/PulD (secretin)
MRYLLFAILTSLALADARRLDAQQSSPQASSEESATAAPEAGSHAQRGVPIEHLIAIVAKKTGKKFVLDPRVRADVVLVGEEPAELTYPQLLTVLSVYGYFAAEDGGYVRVLPDATVRLSAPLITSKDTRLAAEYVTQVIPVRNVSAAQLVPILRPMVSQWGHMAAMAQANVLIVTDSFANVRRMEAIIKTIDLPENKPHDIAPQKEPAQ